MKKLGVLIFLLSLGVLSNDFTELKKRRVANTFMLKANEVIAELSNHNEIHLVNEVVIDLNILREALERTVIQVLDKDLVDNTGSLVDVIGEPLSLTLSLERWIDFQKSNQDLRPLIIHELLRISSINDDDYHLSRPLYLLVKATDPKRETVPYCNLRVAKTKTTIKKKKFSGVGYEPMQTSGGSFTISSGSRVSFDNAVADVKEKCEKAGYYGFEYISGQTRSERRNTNGFIRMETKTSIRAYCFKDSVKKRKRREVKKEACQKVAICIGLDNPEILKVKKEYSCD